VLPWPDGYYENTANRVWTPCHSYCTKWYGSLTTQCTEWDIDNRYTLISPDTCVYHDWPSLYYYDAALYSCMECSNLCTDCYGPSTSNCLTCPYSRFIDNTTDSCKTCSEINSGLKFVPLTNTWLERCGKGSNLGFIEWDDGNRINGDGWNEFWDIEVDWTCSGGSPSTADSCISLIGPEWTLTYISSNNYIATLAFSESVTITDLMKEHIDISIEGPLAPYSFEFTIEYPPGYVEGQPIQKFMLKFDFQSSLSGKNSGKH